MPRVGFRGSVLVAVLVAVTMMMAVPNTMDTKAALPEDETTLRIGFMQKVDSLNPNIGLTDASYILYGLLYDSLQCVGNDLESEPNIALSWGVADDFTPYGSVWDYTLTQNAYWHDGEPLTAEDVVFTLNINAEYFTTMWAYQPYAYYIDYAEVIGDNVVRVHFFDRPTGDPMPVAFADSLFIPILPKHMLEDMSPAEISFTWIGVFEASDPPIVGTGPFMATADIYDEFLGHDKLTLVRNPNHHWAADRDKTIEFDKIEMLFFDDSFAMAIALEIGEIDVAQFPPWEYTTIKHKIMDGVLEDAFAFDGPKCTQYWTEVAINMNNAGPNPSRLDPTIRQAMAMATNKEYINNNHYLGLGEPGTTLIPPVNEEWHYEPTDDELYHYDIDAANNLLEASGYRYTEDSPDVRVCTADSWACQEGLVPEDFPLSYEMVVRQEYPEERDIAMYLQYEWAKIGVEVDYLIVTEATLGAIVYGYSYDTVIWYWSSEPDPHFMLFCQSGASWYGWNDNMYSTPEYEENFTASVQELDHELRRDYVHNCQKVHYEDVAYIILDYVDQTYVWRTDTFAGWGDWEANLGRSIDAYWGGNPLYFDLRPLDHSPPVSVVSLSGAIGDSGWYTSSVEVTISAMAFASDIDWTRYRIDGTEWLNYTEPFEISEEGMHELEYYSKDIDDLNEELRTIDIKIDKTAPELEIDDGQTMFDSRTVNITWSCSDSCSGVDHVEYSLDGGAYATCEGDGQLQLTNVSDGTHTIQFVIYDNAWNNATAQLTFEIDAPEEDQEDGEPGTASIWVIAGIVAVAAASAAAAIVLRKGKGRRSPPGGDSSDGSGPL
jgi:peptide/nickel transport system substrate-binding protein